jgi:hypothetical protein
MRTASGLTLLAIGAIFTFAITAHPSFLNLQIVGVVLMATGVAGLFLPKPRPGWLRRRTVLRDPESGTVEGTVDERRYPPYVMLNPGSEPGEEHHGHQPGDLTAAEAAEPRSETAPLRDLPVDDLIDERETRHEREARHESAPAEVVEEYVEE